MAIGTCAHRKHTMDFDCNVFSPCSRHEWGEKFQLGYVVPLNRRWISDCDAFSHCCRREYREECQSGDVRTAKQMVIVRLQCVRTLL